MDLLRSYNLVTAAACETEYEKTSFFIWMSSGSISIGNARKVLQLYEGMFADGSAAIDTLRLEGHRW